MISVCYKTRNKDREEEMSKAPGGPIAQGATIAMFQTIRKSFHRPGIASGKLDCG